MLLPTTVFILLLCGGLQAEELTEKFIEPRSVVLTTIIKSIWQCMQPKLADGLENFNIPPLDPLQVDEVALDDLGSGFIHLNSLIVNGILNLDILDVDYSNEVTCGSTTCTEISAELLLPSISLSTGYDADVTLFDTLRVYGNGNISLVINDLAPSLKVAINFDEFGIEEFNLAVGIGEVDFQATGLLNDEYMSKLISNMITRIIKEHFQEILQHVVNAIGSGGGEINDDTLAQLVALLEELLTGCLGEGDTKAINIGALFRRR